MGNQLVPSESVKSREVVYVVVRFLA